MWKLPPSTTMKILKVFFYCLFSLFKVSCLVVALKAFGFGLCVEHFGFDVSRCGFLFIFFLLLLLFITFLILWVDVFWQFWKNPDHFLFRNCLCSIFCRFCDLHCMYFRPFRCPLYVPCPVFCSLSCCLIFYSEISSLQLFSFQSQNLSSPVELFLVTVFFSSRISFGSVVYCAIF